MINLKNGKQIPQYSWYGETYDYDAFRTMDGVKPGLTVNEKHLELGYTKQVGIVNLNVSAYGDWYSVQNYQPVSDSIRTYVYNNDGEVIIIDGKPQVKTYKGLMQYLDFQEYTIGSMAKADANYTLGSM